MPRFCQKIALMKFTLRKENVIKIAQKIPYRCDDKDKKKMKEKSVTNLKIQQTICNNLNDLPKKKMMIY